MIATASPETARPAAASRSGWAAPCSAAQAPAGQRSRVRYAALLFCCALPLCPAASAAKHTHKPKPVVEIVAQGKVLNGGAPASDAVVYLENPISLAIKSYLTGPTGEFHFNNLSPQTDYEVWAELNGVQSKHKFISQFSNHTKFLFTLKLQKAGKHKLFGIF